MTTLDKTIRNARRTTANAGTAATNAANSGEMLRAASDVIAARMTLMAEGLANPMKADMREMSLMGTEKMEAMSASATAVAASLGDVAARVSQSAMDEVGYAQKAASAIASAGTPQAAAAAHYSYAVAWWGRAAGQMLTLNTELMKAQADALKPIHSVAVANAKRLKK
ncbi:MAG: phasin family protein [Brevundimonas sp.]|uniref:phasin family protein n=1 Tax=Brevundimonas sp. TaxID=1871086 RepID=UPI002736D237|nr:phasin family protein [Brevundimonas sp.]MDP3404710.1 phasin family protein [Brevundimonas sp.]